MAKAFPTIGFALVGGALLAATPPAQGDGTATFADPVRMQAGDKMMGEARLYPSPVLHDVDGDGLQDMVIGDLFGKITVAPRLSGDGAPRFGPEAPLQAADGKELKFHNW